MNIEEMKRIKPVTLCAEVFRYSPTEDILEWLYRYDREMLEEISFRLMEENPYWVMCEGGPGADEHLERFFVAIHEVLIQTDPALSTEDIQRLNEAAAKLMELE